MIFHKGQKAKIIGNTNHHHYKTGTIVKLLILVDRCGEKLTQNYWRCDGKPSCAGAGRSWYVKETDLAPINMVNLHMYHLIKKIKQ